ncbi:S41 family peptidase [Chitinophaga sp.]|uniref:S41 family peptidase n=1 Tax=Chitinophaga sp. TaxID=1869181 RepID=UPI0031D50A87
MQRLIYIFFLLASTFIVCSYGCKKNLVVLNPPNQYTTAGYNDIFESFWNGMNNNYVFWDIDTTNWDNMYRIYKPLFAQLDTARDKSKVRDYFRAMTSGLIDGHYSLKLLGSLGSPKTTIYPPGIQRSAEKRHHNRPPSLLKLYGNISDNYFDENTAYFKRPYTYLYFSNPVDTTIFMFGKIKNAPKSEADNILYIKFNRFELKSGYGNRNSAVIRSVIDSFFSHVHDASVTALIVDLRSNGGGSLDDMHFLVGHLIDQPLHWGYSKYKNGNGRLDYTPWVKNIVTPQPGGKAFNKPVIVLVDVQSISMAEMTTLALKALPAKKTVIIGERTWGGLGGLTGKYDSPNYNGGKFTFGFDPAYGEVYTPSGQVVDLDKRNYEGKGIPPSITVPYDEQSWLGIKDAPLDRAIQYIRTGQ